MTSNAIGTTKDVNPAGRLIDVVCVPYDELSYLTPNPAGEKVMYGAFADACREPHKVFLFRGHDHQHPVGRAVALWEEPSGLRGCFLVRESALGDEVLADVMDGFFPACSVGFRPTSIGRGASGESVVLAGDLREVSLLPIGAYDSAKVLSVRRATDRPGVWMPRTSAASSSRERLTQSQEFPAAPTSSTKLLSTTRSAPPARGKLGTLRL